MDKNKIIESTALSVISVVVAAAMLLTPSTVTNERQIFDYSYEEAEYWPNAPTLTAPDKAESERVEVSILMGKSRVDVLAEPEETVGVLLEKADIKLTEKTVLNYDAGENVFDGMTVTVGEHIVKTYVETTEIEYGITYVGSQTIPKGTTKLKSEGKPGKMAVTHEIVTLGGEMIEDTVLASNVIEEPVNAVYYKGTGGTLTAKDGTQYAFSYYIEMEATAYEAKGITATGKPATDGIIAVDPRVIPYGTKVFVTGKYAEIGVCSAEDTGGAIKGNRIDICMSGPISKLYQFGRRKMIAYILE